MGSKTQSNEVSPWDSSVPYAEEILAQGQDAYDNTTSQIDFTGLSAEQIANVNGLMDYFSTTGGNQTIVDQSATGMNKLLTATDDWTNNEALIAGMNANQIASDKQLTQTYLPAVRSGAATAGQYGSSRQGVAEGVALGESNNNLQIANASLLNNYYNQAVSQEALGMNLIPQSQDIAQSGYAGVIDGQQILDDNTQAVSDANWYNENQAMWDQLAKYQSVVNPYTGIGSTTTTTGGGASTGAQVAGAATAGLGAYGALTAAGAAGPIGIGAGALIGAASLM